VRGTSGNAILLYQDWGFDLEEIEFPVSIYHGEQDRFAPFTFAEYLHGRMPHTTLHRYPGEGHLFLYRLFDEILESGSPAG
jgi:pimeloyl-ACP methyl ester carboxylesterase